MSLPICILLGAACGWVSAGPFGGKSGGNVGASVVAGAVCGLVLALIINFFFGFLFLVAKVAVVIFGVLIVLALLGVGDSDD